MLKNLPIGYTALLKDIKLINFTIRNEDLLPFIPRLPLIKIEGRPVISLLDVKLNRLCPSFLFNTLHFTYRHIAFRILIQDHELHEDRISRGIYYLHSFTDDLFIAGFGKMFTNFNFKHAFIKEENNNFHLRHKNNFFDYTLDPETCTAENDDLKRSLMQIDRAYSLSGERLKVTKVRRNDLPLHAVNCSHFKTDFFKNADLLGAFCVKEVLNYEWMPPQKCILSALSA